MKIIIKAALLFALLLGGSQVYAQTLEKSKMTTAEVYEIYNHITPKELLFTTLKANEVFVKRNGDLTEFNQFPNRWYQGAGKGNQIIIIDCKKMALIGHPFPDFKKILGVKGFIRNIVDINGKPFGVKACRDMENLEKNPNRQPFFMKIENYWPGASEPVQMLMIVIQAGESGGPLRISNALPTTFYSIEKLNSLIPQWLKQFEKEKQEDISLRNAK